jgi:hypothetical protein
VDVFLLVSSPESREDYYEEREREVGGSERGYGWGEQNLTSVLKVPIHCPFVLLFLSLSHINPMLQGTFEREGTNGEHPLPVDASCDHCSSASSLAVAVKNSPALSDIELQLSVQLPHINTFLWVFGSQKM